MKLDVIKLDGAAAGSVDLSDEIWGLEPRAEAAAHRRGRRR